MSCAAAPSRLAGNVNQFAGRFAGSIPRCG